MSIDVNAVVARARQVTGRSFATRDLVVLPRDGFTLVVLADDLMAYVATNDDGRAALAWQRKALTRVAPRVSFALPRPAGPIDLAADIDLRVPARGVTGFEHHERILRDGDLAARVGEWMGKVLAELHDALAPSELDALGVPSAEWPLPAAHLPWHLEQLDGATRRAADVVIDAWHSRAVEPDVLVHGDFGSHNFAFDATNGMPIGLFDFHDGGRGSRVFDFALLPSYPDVVLERARSAYGPKAPSIDAIRIAHAVAAIAYHPYGEDKAAGVAWVQASIAAAQNCIRKQPSEVVTGARGDLDAK